MPRKNATVDQQLTGLLVQFWATGDHDSARVLADRFQELSAEQVAEALVKFWALARAVQALGEVGLCTLNAPIDSIFVHGSE